MKNILLALAGLVLTASQINCYPSGGMGYGGSRHYYPSHQPQRVVPSYSGSSYGVIRDSRTGRVIRREGAVWGTMPRRR